MHHTSKAKLLIFLDANPGDLEPEELAEFDWLAEQLHAETTQLIAARNAKAVTAAQPNLGL